MTSTAVSRRLHWPGFVGIVGLALLFGGLGIDVFHQISRGRLGAVFTYYHAAVMLNHGQDPYAGHSSLLPYVYPPMYALCFKPLTRMSPASAARVMFGVNTCFILAAIAFSAKAMLRRVGACTSAGNLLFVSMMTAIIVSIPIHNELRGLETNSIILLSFALALYALDDHPVLAGIALAVAINIKYLPIIAVPYFLLRRRFKAAISTLAASVLIACLPALGLGWSTNLRYLHEAVSGLGNLAGSDSGSGAAQVNVASAAQGVGAAPVNATGGAQTNGSGAAQVNVASAAQGTGAAPVNASGGARDNSAGVAQANAASASQGTGAAQVNGTGDLSSVSITSTIARLGTSSHWAKPAQLALVGMIAGAWGAVVLLGYRRRKLPIVCWPGPALQRDQPMRGMVAVEWAALVTFAMAFSPNTQNRNLVLAIVPASLAAALICSPLPPRGRWMVAFAALLMAVALTLPIDSMGKTFTVGWLAIGGVCWSLLILFLIFAHAGLSAATSSARLSPEGNS